jgi:hypothetical protein
MRSVSPAFSMTRMVKEYMTELYYPAMLGAQKFED